MISIRHRRGTAAQWTSANPVLAMGELGLETDTWKFKFGNGIGSWSQLDYFLSDALNSAKFALKTALTTKADLVNGVIPTSQIPAIAINETFVINTQTAMLALVAQRGDVAVRTDFTPERWYMLTNDAPGTLANWRLMSTAGSGSGNITTVNGQAGPAVVLGKADVGLANVSNLAPADLGISTATQNALNALTTRVANLEANAGAPNTTGLYDVGRYDSATYA